MPDFSALHVALSGLRAAQMRMDTASHNVSNANTPGFTRQRVDLATRYPRLTPDGQVGLGVDVTDISRVRDLFLDARYRSSVSMSGTIDVRSELLRRAELATGEPDQGITTELSGLWDSFEDLALDPSDRASRIAVLRSLEGVAARVNDVAQGLEGLTADASRSMTATIDEINLLLGQVADLNVAIVDASASPGTPNDLMDQRDQLVDRLARITGVTTRDDGNGSITVAIGGISLVSGSNATTLTFDSSTNQVLHPSGVALIPGGEAGGYLQALTTDLPNLAAELDAFAVSLVDALNAAHQSGYSQSGAGGPLLGYDMSAPALTLTTMVSDPDELATAATAGPPFPTFDAAIPEQLAALRTEPVALGGTASLEDVMRAFITTLGQETAAAKTGADTQRRLAEAASLSRDGSHGVSVDEEMVNLMEAQRMYEAAARVVTAVDQALDTVINRMGAVGR